MSPDGAQIAALRPAVGYQHGELCTFDTSTLAEVACASLQPLDAGLRLDSVTWSPDGAHLALAEEAFTYLRDGDLWLMDASTGGLVNLDDDGYSGKLIFGGDAVQGTITVPASPTFTPDGLAVTYSRSTFRDRMPVGNDIAIAPIAGGPAKHLVQVSDTAPGLAYFGMRWAPDGETLYYSINDVSATSTINGIWAVEADGTDMHQVAGATDPDLGEPAAMQVSSDGSHILAWYPEAPDCTGRRHTICRVIDPSSGSAAPLVLDTDPTLVSRGVVQMATFSPDGRRLAGGDDPDRSRSPGAAPGCRVGRRWSHSSRRVCRSVARRRLAPHRRGRPMARCSSPAARRSVKPPCRAFRGGVPAA